MARIVLVTGGVTGIGAATCKALKTAGHTVTANYFDNAATAERFRNETAFPSLSGASPISTPASAASRD
jgi:acetoacetyl-CoA reductase